MKIERNQLRSDIFPWHCSELKKKGAVAKVRGLVKTKTEKTPADGISPVEGPSPVPLKGEASDSSA